MELDKKAYFKHEASDDSVRAAYLLEVIRRRLTEYCRTARAECQILETRRRLIEYCRTARAECQILEAYNYFLYNHFLPSIDKMERIGFLAEGTRDAIDYVLYRLDGEWGKEETLVQRKIYRFVIMGTTKLELDKKAYFSHADSDDSVRAAYLLEVIRRRLIEYCCTSRAECQIVERYTHFLCTHFLPSIGKMECIGFLVEGTRDAIDYVLSRLDREWGKEETSDNHNSVQERE